MNIAMYTQWSRRVKACGIEAAADEAVRLGFSSVEFFEFTGEDWEETVPSLEAAREYRRVLSERGLSVACYSVAAGLYDPMSPDGIDRAVEEKLMKYVERAVLLGSPYLHHTLTLGVSGTPIPYGKMLTAILPAAVRVAKYAASLGVTCIYEDQGLYFNGVDGFGAFYRAVKAKVPSVGICGDVGNTLFVNENPLDFFRTYASEFKHVHLKDYVVCDASDEGSAETRDGTCVKECVIGEGIVDAVTALQILKESGYTGAIALENGHAGSFEAGVAVAMELINKTFNL
ncbi:MAG: sugar phosphate isomerase/epimerase [Clostridia bacterium]|nr:sugar phosphate isomerase/epimerase [Clostridia bacterium]